MKRIRGLTVGDLAPDFTLSSTEGEAVRLYDKLDAGPVVLFFYLKAFTPLCVSEACAFQSELPAFESMDAQVFGVSPDSRLMAMQFKKALRLNFPLLLDVERKVRDAFQVPRLLGFIPGRSTFVINREKRIAGITHADAGSRVHVEESLRFLLD